MAIEKRHAYIIAQTILPTTHSHTTSRPGTLEIDVRRRVASTVHRGRWTVHSTIPVVL